MDRRMGMVRILLYKRDYGCDPYKYFRLVKSIKKYREKIMSEISEIIRYTHIERSTFALFTAPKCAASVEERISKFRLCAKIYFSDKPYLFVVEKHVKGGFHIHAIIFNVGVLDVNAMTETNGGYVYLKELKPSDNVARYLVKYITKDRVTKRAYYFHNVVRCPY